MYPPISQRISIWFHHIRGLHDFGNGLEPAHKHKNGGGWVANCSRVDPTAFIDRFSEVHGANTYVGAGSHIFEAIVGPQAHVGQNCRICSISIGSRTHLDNGVNLKGPVMQITVTNLRADKGVVGNISSFRGTSTCHITGNIKLRGSIRIWVPVQIIGTDKEAVEISNCEFGSTHSDRNRTVTIHKAGGAKLIDCKISEGVHISGPVKLSKCELYQGANISTSTNPVFVNQHVFPAYGHYSIDNTGTVQNISNPHRKTKIDTLKTKKYQENFAFMSEEFSREKNIRE